jgi:hypothetical protein
MWFSKLLKDYSRAEEKSKIIPRPSNMVYLFLEICWSVVEVILKSYRRLFNVILKKYPISYISPICFQLNRGENGKYNSSSKKQFKVKKLV